MRSFSATFIGSMSAWLPSLRSTLHHRGGRFEDRARPGPVGQVDGLEGTVLAVRHGAGARTGGPDGKRRVGIGFHWLRSHDEPLDTLVAAVLEAGSSGRKALVGEMYAGYAGRIRRRARSEMVGGRLVMSAATIRALPRLSSAARYPVRVSPTRLAGATPYRMALSSCNPLNSPSAYAATAVALFRRHSGASGHR